MKSGIIKKVHSRILGREGKILGCAQSNVVIDLTVIPLYDFYYGKQNVFLYFIVFKDQSGLFYRRFKENS